jgi:hypothetical protein
MIMEVSQTFRISHGEWVCGGCGAPMTEAADQTVVMTHEKGCSEVRGIQAGQA